MSVERMFAYIMIAFVIGGTIASIAAFYAKAECYKHHPAAECK